MGDLVELQRREGWVLHVDLQWDDSALLDDAESLRHHLLLQAVGPLQQFIAASYVDEEGIFHLLFQEPPSEGFRAQVINPATLQIGDTVATITYRLVEEFWDYQPSAGERAAKAVHAALAQGAGSSTEELFALAAHIDAFFEERR